MHPHDVDRRAEPEAVDHGELDPAHARVAVGPGDGAGAQREQVRVDLEIVREHDRRAERARRAAHARLDRRVRLFVQPITIAPSSSTVIQRLTMSRSWFSRAGRPILVPGPRNAPHTENSSSRPRS